MSNRKNKRRGYQHIGGGTLLFGNCGRYPSDDTYQHLRTGDVLIVKSKVNTHFTLPSWVDGPYQLRRRKGVGSVKKMTQKEYSGN